MIQREFTKQIIDKIKIYPDVVGLAVGGSWITDEMDEYSDLDLVLVSKTRFSDDKNKMIRFASGLGSLLNAFTGEHVGEPRVLICLYENPFLHVDIKFITPEELKVRVEDPVVLWERDNTLTEIIKSTKSQWPKLDFQWIEDRFWTWIHYATLKIGRGEYFETLDFLSYLRVTVIAPLLQLKNRQLPRGLRKVEFNFNNSDLESLKLTVPKYEINSIVNSLDQIIELYQDLRRELYPDSIRLNETLRVKAQEYLNETKKKFDKK
jgi:predicted nucleotidyltransferase